MAQSGKEEADAVIVAGGDHYTPPLSDGYIQRVQLTSEIFMLKERQWVQGPTLPHGFYLGGYTTNLETNTVMLAGGFGDHYDDHADIIQYNEKTNLFQMVPARLAKSKHLFGLTSFLSKDKC